MLENCRNAQERWGGVNELVDRWLRERHELVLAHKGLIDAAQLPASNSFAVQRYCQVLLDYLSAGHFEVYELLTSEAKAHDDARALQLAQQIYPRLEVITREALAFNDLCDNGDCRDDVSMAEKLQRLGTMLLERFELEDCLIEVLHNAYRQREVAFVTASAESSVSYV